MNNSSKTKTDFSRKLSMLLIELAEADLNSKEADLISESGLQKLRVKTSTAN